MKADDIIGIHSEDGVKFYRLVPVESRACQRCAAVFPVTDQRQVFCGERCQSALNKRRLRNRRRLEALSAGAR